MGQTVDHHIVAAWLAQVKGFYSHPLHFDVDNIAIHRNSQLQALHQFFIADRPADIGAQRQANFSRDITHSGSPFVVFAYRNYL